MQIKVKDARSKLSSLLDRVEKGEEIIITRRGKKVARLHCRNTHIDRCLFPYYRNILLKMLSQYLFPW